MVDVCFSAVWTFEIIVTKANQLAFISRFRLIIYEVTVSSTPPPFPPTPLVNWGCKILSLPTTRGYRHRTSYRPDNDRIEQIAHSCQAQRTAGLPLVHIATGEARLSRSTVSQRTHESRNLILGIRVGKRRKEKRNPWKKIISRSFKSISSPCSFFFFAFTCSLTLQNE